MRLAEDALPPPAKPRVAHGSGTSFSSNGTANSTGVDGASYTSDQPFARRVRQPLRRVLLEVVRRASPSGRRRGPRGCPGRTPSPSGDTSRSAVPGRPRRSRSSRTPARVGGYVSSSSASQVVLVLLEPLQHRLTPCPGPARRSAPFAARLSNWNASIFVARGHAELPGEHARCLRARGSRPPSRTVSARGLPRWAASGAAGAGGTRAHAAVVGRRRDLRLRVDAEHREPRLPVDVEMHFVDARRRSSRRSRPTTCRATTRNGPCTDDTSRLLPRGSSATLPAVVAQRRCGARSGRRSVRGRPRTACR